MTVNQWIKGFAEEEGKLLLDFQPVLSDSKGFRKKEFATKDGERSAEVRETIACAGLPFKPRNPNWRLKKGRIIIFPQNPTREDNAV
jgi:hypothetical protein